MLERREAAPVPGEVIYDNPAEPDDFTSASEDNACSELTHSSTGPLFKEEMTVWTLDKHEVSQMTTVTANNKNNDNLIILLFDRMVMYV